MSAPEACWRIFGFSLHREYPSHERLAVHLPDEQTVIFAETSDLQQIVDDARAEKTTLLQWFKTNREDADARRYKYTEFPEHYRWDQSGKCWFPRGNVRMSIGRIYNVSPREQERYYLRLLLLTVPGATGYEFLRTFEGVTHPTFKAACRARGLLESDDVWNNCLNEAAAHRTPYMLRQLFVIILVFCVPSAPFRLWENHRTNLSEDYLLRLCVADAPISTLTEEQTAEAHNNCLYK